MKTTNSTIEQQRADNVYLWLSNTERDYNRVVELFKQAKSKFHADNVSAEWTAQMLYKRYYCGQRTGDNVYYTLDRIRTAVYHIMDLKLFSPSCI